MERIDNDTWDLATTVGATATMVAAARALATNADDPLIDDPFAEPLIEAVGIDFFTRWATGELDPADVDVADSPWGRAADDRPLDGPHPIFRCVLPRRDGGGHPSGGDPACHN